MVIAEFKPALRDGVPVAADLPVPLDFGDWAHVTEPPRRKPGGSTRISRCYSRSARQAGAEGQVTVVLSVEADGRVGRYELPAGIEPWQEATAKCVIGQLEFEPATRDGVPVAARVRFPINFSLAGSAPLTLAKVAASDDEKRDALRACTAEGSQAAGTPEFRVTVNERGSPSQVALVKSSGDPVLDSTGACVLEKLRYDPATRGERPVVSTILVPLTLRPPN